ncbi:hypothetical protein H6F67_15690 [Microcoleus sp. FACHB-1515]|uniref:hypothetical protein n=1 Tax=Cyanophyceae TaxID=3028117 RepID=UPI001685395A|nr:hypothetical protein [Microcoleus sp. FACHB-1515]MBD2091297.1 hypothetical protein [Microcoleus sp. FACHB-1515]
MQDDRWEWKREPLPRLYYDGENYYPEDGHHCIRSARQAQKESIYCDAHPGTLRDAKFYSIGANRYHGLPRSNLDKRSAVEIALTDPEWCQTSDRAIADHWGNGGDRLLAGLSAWTRAM